MTNEELSYSLGFHASDGYTDSRGLVIFYSTDLDIIDKLKSIWSVSTKTYERYGGDTGYSKCYGFTLGKKKSEQLIELGALHNKDNIRVPNFVGFEFRHWLRGFIDGDGSWHFDKGKPTGVSILGRPELVKQIQEHLGYGTYHSYQRLGRKEMAVLSISLTQCKCVFINYLYDNASVFLNRKYEKAIKYKEYLNSKSKVKYGKGISFDSKLNKYRIRKFHKYFESLEEAQNFMRANVSGCNF